jgi:carbamoyltransferase
MKLLSLRLCEHDSNISYWDGESLHYFKSERKYKEKHHGYNNLDDWISDIEGIWNVSPYEIDDICIVLDEWRYNTTSITESFFPSKPLSINHPILKKATRLNHHYAHALSAQFSYGLSDVDIVIDGFGDLGNIWTVFKNDSVFEIGTDADLSSIGRKMSWLGNLLYIENKTHGLDVAGKVMGLQSYGSIDKGYHDILNSYDMEKVSEIFSYEKWVKYNNDKVVSKLKRLDWARTIHQSIEELLVRFFKKYADKNSRITYSGGVAQNVIWNTRLKKEFPNLHIPPHCSDEGLTIGGIEFLRRKHNLSKMSLSKFPYSQTDETTDVPSLKTITLAANALAENKIVAWYQGNGEIGPRALGNRSILMNPLVEDGKNKINSVKRREGYRPFGAVVLDEYKQDYFEVNQDFDNPYMLYVANVKDKRLKCITHVDGTCRIQTLKNENPVLRSLMEEFYKLTGCPILLNTSLNLAGKPISACKEDVYELMKTASIDIGVVGDTIINNSNMPV